MNGDSKIQTHVLTVTQAQGGAADEFRKKIALDQEAFPFLKNIMVNTRQNGGDSNYGIGIVSGVNTIEEPHHNNNFIASTAVDQQGRRYPIGIKYAGSNLYIILSTSKALVSDLVVEIAFEITKLPTCDA